ncbi:hypothetical protein [Niallia sp. Krafla_26]|uniref:hypothetical protein n=1 Tax=Niallia sp. Krafla_26 TaxID=3064703 RepID=UPI003D1688A3
MKKNTLFVITWLYGISLVVSFVIYAFQVADENGTIHTEDQRTNLTTFAVALFFAVILFSINASAHREEGDTVKKSHIFAGFSLAAFFIVWRFSVQFF